MTDERLGLRLYRNFVDELVALRDCVMARWVTERRPWPDQPENRAANDLVGSLDDAQREILARLLQQARDGGIHNVLAFLNDRMELANLRLVCDGEEMPVEPFDTGLHYDWVCRCQGDPWPPSGDAT